MRDKVIKGTKVICVRRQSFAGDLISDSDTAVVYTTCNKGQNKTLNTEQFNHTWYVLQMFVSITKCCQPTHDNSGLTYPYKDHLIKYIQE